MPGRRGAGPSGCPCRPGDRPVARGRRRHRAIRARACAARARGALDRAAGGRRPAFSAGYGYLVCPRLLSRDTGCADLERASHRLERGERDYAMIESKGRDVLLVTGERSMRQPNSRRVISRDKYDAVLLDLDGVITDTASIHAACWKQMFDEYLQKRATQRGEAFRPFDLVTDYRLYVDGKPRFDGVRDFLASRGIQLPEGHPDDPPQLETVGGLGNRKNDLVNEAIEDKGVKPYAGSVQFVHHLRRHGFKIAVVTSSQNCAAVLKAVNLDACFEVQVDGNMIQAQQLAGKPAPDTYLKAAKLLGVEPARAVVIEDAISGVQAGFNGNFGLVIGVARKGNAEELKQHGAHLVVSDLGELVD